MHSHSIKQDIHVTFKCYCEKPVILHGIYYYWLNKCKNIGKQIKMPMEVLVKLF